MRLVREGLGWLDLLVVAGGAVALGTLIPLVGAFLGGWLFWALLSRRCRPRTRETLPAVQTELPPRELRPGIEYVAAAGLLLLLSALLLAIWPLAALVPAIGLLWVLISAWRYETHDPAAAATNARLETLFEETALALESNDAAVDERLALQGALEELASRWRVGDLDDDRALLAVQGLRREVAGPRAGDADRARGRVEALRRAQAELSGPS